MQPLPLWIDGELHDPGEPALEVDDSSVRWGQACYTSALVRGGEARWANRHVARLQRDAAALGLRAPDPRLVLQAFSELGRSCFDVGEGIVRLQASGDGPANASRLIATARALGNNNREWKAGTHSTPHPGPGPWPGVKCVGDPYLASARAVCRARQLDEVILVDCDGYVLEGSRSSLVLLDASGDLVTPDPRRGGVRSIAIEILGEALPELKRRNLSLETLRQSREAVAVNAVRGARRIGSLDERALGSASETGLASKLGEVLDRAVG